MNKRGVFVKGFCFGVVAICLLGLLLGLSNRIIRDGKVKELKSWGIVAEDCTGRKWAYHTSEGFEVGDNVRIVFDYNNTLDNFTDDRLLKIRLDK